VPLPPHSARASVPTKSICAPSYTLLCALSASAFTSIGSSFGFKLQAVNFPSLSPFLVYPGLRRASLTNPAQVTENTSTLIPESANLDAASSISPLFATLTKNTGGGGTPLYAGTAELFSIARVSRDESWLSSFPSYQRLFVFSARLSVLCASALSFYSPGLSTVNARPPAPISPAVGPGLESLVHCLPHGGSHLEQIRLPQPSGRAHNEFPNVFRFSLNYKTKASKSCSRD